MEHRNELRQQREDLEAPNVKSEKLYKQQELNELAKPRNELEEANKALAAKEKVIQDLKLKNKESSLRSEDLGNKLEEANEALAAKEKVIQDLKLKNKESSLRLEDLGNKLEKANEALAATETFIQDLKLLQTAMKRDTKTKLAEQGKQAEEMVTSQMGQKIWSLMDEIIDLRSQITAIPFVPIGPGYEPVPPVSQKHALFVGKRIYESTPVTDIPGIGEAGARNLSWHGITKAAQIWRYYENTGFNSQKTTEWMMAKGVASQYWRLAAIRALKEYCPSSL